MLKTNEEINERDIIEKRKIYGSIKMFWSTDLNQHISFIDIQKCFLKKMNDYFKQKASLETSLTFDRVSIRAINENAKLRSKISKS